MEITFESSHGTTTTEKVETFEHEINSKLPSDYREFLVQENGGLPSKPLFELDGNVYEIFLFFPLLEANQGLPGLKATLMDHADVLPERFMAIAGDSHDEYICIQLEAGEYYGSIWLVEGIESGASEIKGTIIAPSFKDFLQMLIPKPEIVDPVADIAENGSSEELETFLLEGNSINDRSTQFGYSMVAEASKYGNEAIVRLCIKHNAVLDDALHLASYNQHFTIVKLLCEAGADVNRRDKYGSTVLDFCGDELDDEIKAYLEERGAHY